MNLTDRIRKIIEVPDGRQRKIVLRKRLYRVERSYRTVKAEVDDDKPGVGVYTLQGYEERVRSYEAKLRAINGDLLSIDDAEDLED